MLDLTGRLGPPYRRVAEAIRDAIEADTLRPGDPLPPQRRLAWDLGLATATVTRGYALAAEWGLLTARVGSGTRVAHPMAGDRPSLSAPTERIDLGLLRPARTGNANLRRAAYRDAFADVGAELERARSSYTPELGIPADREAGAAYLATRGIVVPPGRVAVCQGAQEAFLMIVSLLTEPGDPILVEGLAYLGLKTLLEQTRRRPVAVEMDAEGARPDALERAARRSGARLAVLTPALQNPTGAVQSAARREAIGEVLRERDLLAIEDDAFSPLCREAAAPLWRHAPDRVFAVHSLAKLAAPALRIAYLAAPDRFMPGLERAKHATAMSGPTADAAVASKWVRAGIIERLARDQAAEIGRRRALLEADLLDLDLAPDWAPFLWLDAPRPDAVATLAARGVKALGADSFAVPGASVPNRLRLSLTTLEDRGDLRTAADTVRAVWSE